jgi:hypothetical protein
MVATLEAEAARFNAEVRKFTKRLTRDELVLFHKKIHLEALRRVVLKTPVDTGRARGNWQTTLGTPADGEVDRLDKRGGGVIASEGLGKLTLLRAFSTSWLTNNVPYIEVLERGLYPNPVKFGSYVPRRRGGRRHVIRSAGGYSKQAPNGMLAVTLAELRLIFP